MRASSVIFVALLLTVAPMVAAHKFNHEDRHEFCQVDVAPHGHGPDDGHNHTHDPFEGAALHNHDPCKQVRMGYPWYESTLALKETTIPNIELDPRGMLFSDGDPNNTEVYVAGEAYRFPVAEGTFRKQTNLVVTSDLQARGMGFPGSGTEDDPYIVENYFITNTMLFKDTSACFEIRNNVVVDQTLAGPLVPDVHNIIDLKALIPDLEAAIAQAEQLRDTYLGYLAGWDATKAGWEASLASWEADKAGWDAQLAEYQATQAQWDAAWATFDDEYDWHIGDVEYQAESFLDYASQYTQTAEPVRDHAAVMDDRDLKIPAFEGYQQEVNAWIDATPPPDAMPPTWPGDADSWEREKQDYATYRAYIQALIAYYGDEIMANAPDQAAYDAFVAAYAQFRAQRDAFLVEYNAFIADYDAFMVDYHAFRAEFDQVMADTASQIGEAQQGLADAAAFDFRYLGHLYNTLEELLAFVLELLLGPDHDNPNDDQGQLILDWNGQCIHAHNNVVHDLRVNQNNDRTGYATGGIIEDNRIYEIGQIRHYDGIFRENEVGDRAHLVSLIDPTVVPPAGRTVNNDGANQGWYHSNVFYGQIDLDFHGHHHSAGFFAPESHYHGSNHNVAYMKKADGSCAETHHTVDHTKVDESAPNPHHEYPTDNDIDVLGTTLLGGADAMTCLPHMDHSKRWTSVFFNDNVVIDPKGVGLRFEDRDHRTDDQKANSENMYELKSPHYHRKWVQMEDNVVLGRIFIDVLNAQGTDLWSDTWEPVNSPAGPARTIEALAHPGAEIVNSHPYRNDAWLDIQRNLLLPTQGTAVLVADAEDLTGFQFKDNKGVAVPADALAPHNRTALLDWLRGAGRLGIDAIEENVTSWGSTTPPTTLLHLVNVRDGFLVEVCGNEARAIARGVLAIDRIYDDGESAVIACGSNDWGTADPAVSLSYTPVPGKTPRFSDPLRERTDDTDDFYVTELVYDASDTLPAGTLAPVEELPSPDDPGHGHGAAVSLGGLL